jgi:hypothetical protein
MASGVCSLKLFTAVITTAVLETSIFATDSPFPQIIYL